jgi:hypothetical protein
MEKTYNQILVNGNEKDIQDFTSDFGVVIDWRQEEDSVVEDFAAKLENEILSAEYSETGLSVNYNGIKHEIPLTFSMKDRYITIRGLMDILNEKYEIRVFENSLGSDTHVFYVKENDWWSFMDKNFPKQMEKIFFKIDDVLDFGEGRDKFLTFGIE